MIRRVAVVGAGTMGAGIAQLCAQSGFSVKVHDPRPEALAALKARLKKGLETGVLKGKLTPRQADAALQAVSEAPALADLAGADLVLEAAPEDLALKQGLFAELSERCPDALLATNTSSLSVAAVFARARAPERALGVHFFNPPVAMRLVEMVRAPQTSPEAFSAAWDFVLSGLKRTPVDVKDVPGFIVNRAMRPYYVASQRLAGRALGVAAADEACRTLGGVPMGPFELMDLIGLDVNLAITKSLYAALGRPERFAPPAPQEALVARGATGRKAGLGFYLYDRGRPVGENPDARELLLEGGAAGGAAFWDSLRGALVAEAERVVSEGTASAADVDVAVKLAMNFPKGPFEWRREGTAARP
ncbi:MAG: NAD(P)-binding domain-containing protein [Elusimicrobia bacterium]|nr:NAD(P)-binding domain-containing protein [Elusimicrobiota bacterium]